MNTTTEITNNGKNGVHQTEQMVRLVPPVDVLDGENDVLVLADMPGVRPEDVTIALENGELRIEGVQSASAEKDPSYRPVLYARAFRVSDALDADGISAEMKHGVLWVRLPKSDRTKPRRIPVKTG